MAKVMYVKGGLDIGPNEDDPAEDDLETVVEDDELDDMEPQEIWEAFQAELVGKYNVRHGIRSMMPGDVIEYSDGRQVKVATAGFEEVEL